MKRPAPNALNLPERLRLRRLNRPGLLDRSNRLNLPLRARVALIMALSTVLALGLQGVLGYLSFYELVLWDLDHDLREFTQETTQRVLRADRLEDVQADFDSYVVHARLLDGARVVQNFTDVPPELRDAPQRQGHYTVGPWRVTHVSVTWKRRPLTLETALTSGEFTAGLRNHRATMLLSAALVTVLAASAAYAISGYALRPLRVLTGVCSRIAASGSLNEQVPTPSHSQGEIRELSLAFNNMLGRLAAFRSREAAFNRQASHELRTPLAAMRLSLDAAREGYSDPLETLDVLDHELRRTQRLANALLILAREGRLAQTERVNLAQLAHTCAQKAGALFQGPPSAPNAPSAWVRGDEVLIVRALENLLENAARYAPGRPVQVTVQVGPDAGASLGTGATGAGPGMVELAVQDSGPGLPEADLPHLTTEFYRSRSGPPKEGSTGLGLSVVQHVMTAHQGHIEIRNVRPQGLRVALRFPAEERSPAEGATAEAQSSGAGRNRG